MTPIYFNQTLDNIKEYIREPEYNMLLTYVAEYSTINNIIQDAIKDEVI